MGRRGLWLKPTCGRRANLRLDEAGVYGIKRPLFILTVSIEMLAVYAGTNFSHLTDTFDGVPESPPGSISRRRESGRRMGQVEAQPPQEI